MADAAAVDVVMPQMGVSVSEGTITKWLKAEGEEVVADEPLLEISTDKVDTEVPAPAGGLLGSIFVAEGETVPVGTRLASIVPERLAAAPPAPPAGEAVPAAPPAAPPVTPAAAPPVTPPAAPAAAPPAEPAPARPATPPGRPPAPAPVAAGEPDGGGEGRAFVSPVVARIAAEHHVDVTRVPGSGLGGRVTKKDILAFIEAGAPALAPAKAGEEAPPAPAAAAPPVAPPPAPAAAAAPPVAPPPAPAAAPPPPPPAAAPMPPQAEPVVGESVEPMSVMRRAIAEHMVRSTQTSAHVTTVFEVDMSRVVAIRERLKGEIEERYGVRLTYLPFICRAVVEALAKWPWLNAEIRGDTIVTKRFVNLGVAVALEGGKGLIVPVIRNAEEKSLVGIARAIADLAERARTKKLLPDEVHGGTFTITNPGGFGAIVGTPIINQPQVAILDVEALVKRPVVVTDELGNDVIAIRPIMNLSLSYDHRLVDGAYAAPFMRDVKTNLETWDESAY